MTILATRPPDRVRPEPPDPGDHIGMARLIGVNVGMSGDPAIDADDMTSEALLAICKAALSYEPMRGAWSTHAYTAALNHVRDRNRRVMLLRRTFTLNRQRYMGVSIDTGAGVAQDKQMSETPDRESEQSHEKAVDDREHVEVLMTCLSDSERSLVRMRFLMSMPTSRIADCLGISVETVRRHLRVALAKMKLHAEGMK